MKLKSFAIGWTLIFLFIVSCSTDLEPVYDRIDNVESQMSTLEKNFESLRNAWLSNKVISDVQYINSSESENSNRGGGYCPLLTVAI